MNYQNMNLSSMIVQNNPPIVEYSNDISNLNNWHYNQMTNFSKNKFNNIYNRQQDNSTPDKEKNCYYKKKQNGEEESKTGKYTCRFEILLDNDQEFQISRRLIGPKGCNMKKIVETVGGTNDFNEVKLRLRGKGSGYKEGPLNRESDDPLHLCVSSKHFDKYQQACKLAQDLINSVSEEYKEYCYKNNKTPLQRIYIKKEEGISSRKTIQGSKQ